MIDPIASRRFADEKHVFMLMLFLSLLSPRASAWRAAEKSVFLGEYEALQPIVERENGRHQQPREPTKNSWPKERAAWKRCWQSTPPIPAADAVELLRARILIDLKKYPEAEAKLNALAGQEKPAAGRGPAVQAKILTETEKSGPGRSAVQGRSRARWQRTADFFAVAIALAFEAPDDTVKREYSPQDPGRHRPAQEIRRVPASTW